jgi:hypothetical protein
VCSARPRYARIPAMGRHETSRAAVRRPRYRSASPATRAMAASCLSTLGGTVEFRFEGRTGQGVGEAPVARSRRCRHRLLGDERARALLASGSGPTPRSPVPRWEAATSAQLELVRAEVDRLPRVATMVKPLFKLGTVGHRAVKFLSPMAHCHIAEHPQSGMMFSFKVFAYGANSTRQRSAGRGLLF